MQCVENVQILWLYSPGPDAPNEGRHNATLDPRAGHRTRPALDYREPCALAYEACATAGRCLHIPQLSFELRLESGPVVVKRSLHFRAHAHKRAAHLGRTSSSATCTPAQPKLPVRFSAVPLHSSLRSEGFRITRGALAFPLLRMWVPTSGFPCDVGGATTPIHLGHAKHPSPRLRPVFCTLISSLFFHLDRTQW